MKTFLLSLHVVGAIILVGPMTVAVTLFPRYARTALVVDGHAAERPAAVTALLHRISRAYAVLGLSVPVVGVALAGRMGVLGDAWVVASLIITVAAATLLAAAVLPAQDRLMAAVGTPDRPRDAVLPTGVRALTPGVFALMWVVVVVLMIARPGSTTGV